MTASEPAAPKPEATLLLPIYKPIKNFPMVNSREVMTAPTQTSDQPTNTRNKSKKNKANTDVVSAKLMMKFKNCANIFQFSSSGAHRLFCADRAALKISDTICRKPMPSIKPIESKRKHNKNQMPE